MITNFVEPAILITAAFESATSLVSGFDPTAESLTPEQINEWQMTLDSSVSVGNRAFAVTSDLDVKWHTLVFEEKVPFDLEVVAAIEGLYGLWRDIATLFLEAVDAFEALGHPVAESDVLRRNRLNAIGLLTPDNAFFEGEELDRLAEEAINADARGETVEFTEMGR